MRCIIVSDTHYFNECLYELEQKYPEAKYFIHCGDLEDFPENYPNWIFVKGNCDYFGEIPTHKILKLDYGHSVYVTHSHHYFNGYRTNGLIANALAAQCDIVCFGHTHVAEYIKENGIHLINPGSMWFPKGNKPGSYAILDTYPGRIRVRIVYNDGFSEWFTKD